mgnify:CR=1 FL=1
MTRRRHSRLVAHIAGAVIGATVLAALVPLPKLLLWNASASAPVGLYWLHPGGKPAVGDFVAIAPPPALARFMAERHYLPIGVPLLKRVAARPGALVCRRDAAVSIDGRSAAIAKIDDSHGRPLPVWRGCRVIEADELFLLNAAPDSLDGRYFGPIPVSGLIGTASPVVTRGQPGAPLRWRLRCPRTAPFTIEEGNVPCR